MRARWLLLAALGVSLGCANEAATDLVDTDAGNGARDVPSARDAGTRPRDVSTAPVDVPRATPDVQVSVPPDVQTEPVDSGSVTAPVDAGEPVVDVEETTPDFTPDGGAPTDVGVAPMPTMGATMRVTASSLNLRTGAGTTNAIVTSMSCGTTVTVVGGPSNGWWNIRYNTYTGWASGAYLVASASFDPSTCGGTPMTMNPPPGTMSVEVARVFELARSGVGYSYYWGHGSWGTDGTNRGSCSGSCPSCTHSGRYGADCSGFVAKVWQIPSPSPITTDLHPYSTYSFVNSTTHWSRVSRSAVRPGDAMTYNTNGSGHIVLFESGSDPWGSLWTYEARGCATGIVHNLRTVGSDYITIRRNGL